MSESGSTPRRFRGLQNALDRAFSAISMWSSRRPWWVLGMALVALVVALYGASMARMDNSLDSYFDEEDPSFRYYKNYIEEFQSDEVIYLLYSVPGKEHGPFDLETMKKIDALTRAIEAEVPFVRKVTSLTNVEFIKAEGDLIEIEALMENFPDSQEELLKLRDLALSKPLYVGSVISKDARHAAVVVEMTRTSTDPIDKLRLDPDGGDDLPNLYPQAPDTTMREILARPEYQGIDFKISGDVPMNSAYNTLMGADLGIITPLSLLLVAVIGVLVMGLRWVSVLAPLTIVIFALIMTLGFMGFTGMKMTLFFMMVPTLLVAVGVAQAVHMILAWQHTSEREPDKHKAVAQTMMKIGTPCLMAAGTTAIGFAGMGGSHLRSLSEMAWYTAFGVMMCFVLSVTLLVTFATRGKGTAKHREPPLVIRGFKALIPGILALNIHHPRKLVVAFTLIGLAFGAGIAKLKIDFNFLHEFKPHIEWRQHTEYINDHMGGLLSVVYLINTGEPDGIKNVQLLKDLEGLQKVADSFEVSQDSVSVADIIKELNQAFHGGDPAYYRLPDDRDTLSQLLLVYELSGGKEMNDVLNLDRSKTALQIRLKLVAASEVKQFVDAMDAYLAQHPEISGKVEVSGIGYLWVQMAKYIASSQTQGYALTFALITLAMILAFGALRIGLLAMIPNLFPIAMAMGLMGWLGWPLDYFRLLLATIAIGIAVDDTIHMTALYKHEFDRCGRYREALERAMPVVGPAMMSTTVILVVAFSAYYASSLAIVASFGFLLSLTIGTALIADLLLLPALILLLKPFGAEHDVAEPADGAAVASSLHFDQGTSR